MYRYFKSVDFFKPFLSELLESFDIFIGNNGCAVYHKFIHISRRRLKTIVKLPVKLRKTLFHEKNIPVPYFPSITRVRKIIIQNNIPQIVTGLDGLEFQNIERAHIFKHKALPSHFGQIFGKLVGTVKRKRKEFFNTIFINIW